MSSGERTQKLIKDPYDAVVNMDEEAAVEASHTIFKEGIDANEAVTNGLAAAMDKVCELYVNQEYFVPELMLCGDVLYAGLDVLRLHIKRQLEVTGLMVMLITPRELSKKPSECLTG
jgi:methanogenic corrinoid protein MtbC1